MYRIVAKFYKNSDAFMCISNPSITIPIANVNDDYCDCPDGSDEPGTSACSYISPLSPPQPSQGKGGNLNETLALPGFYCKNKGHIPSYIPFTNVNDGTCDYELCCDGSDEYEGVGGVKCEDQCAKVGKEWRKQDEIRQKSLNAAKSRRKQLIDDAARLRKEVEDRISTLKIQIEGQTLKVQGLEKSVAEIERAERGKVVKGAGKGGKITVLTSLAKVRIEELTENVGRLRTERDTAKSRVEELEAMLRRFKEEYNPNFNDEGVKRAVKAWEDYAAQDRPGSNDALDRDLDEILKPDSDSAIKWEDFEAPTEESDIEVRKFHVSQPILSPMEQVSNQLYQSTNSKNTSLLQYATGSTPNSATCASFSSKTVSSLTSLHPVRPPSPKLSQTQSHNSTPQSASSTATRPNSRNMRKT
jgi:protein kinase C substrate 80K-H